MPSLRHFTIVNSFLWCFGYGTYIIYTHYTHFIPAWFFFLDILFVQILLYIHTQSIFSLQNVRQILPVSCINAGTFYIATRYANPFASIEWEIIKFIPYSFMFEIVFDFFHYWIHRLFHTSFLFRHFHSMHHRHVAISVYTTFEHHWFDLICSNTIPVFLTVWFLSPSDLFVCVWFLYKIVEEMSGHLGIPIRTSCFPQCVWLPRLFDIALYGTDHAQHHKTPQCNFAKRFRIWDIAFGTYRS